MFMGLQTGIRFPRASRQVDSSQAARMSVRKCSKHRSPGYLGLSICCHQQESRKRPSPPFPVHIGNNSRPASGLRGHQIVQGERSRSPLLSVEIQERSDNQSREEAVKRGSPVIRPLPINEGVSLGMFLIRNVYFTRHGRKTVEFRAIRIVHGAEEPLRSSSLDLRTRPTRINKTRRTASI